jgi:hypothetical protein
MYSVWLVSLSVCDVARAYSYYTFATEGCHERISAEALRRVRDELPAAGPLRTTERDEVIIDELPFPVAEDMRDIGAATLLLGVRDEAHITMRIVRRLFSVTDGIHCMGSGF